MATRHGYWAVLGLLALVAVFGSTAVAAAPPVAASPVAPSGSTTLDTPTYTWASVPTATWYMLWVNDGNGIPRIQNWYTAEQVGCATDGVCNATPNTPASDNNRWWIQTWSPAGYGQWSSGMDFKGRDKTKPKTSCNDKDQDNLIPPQTLATGFESTDCLAADLELTENAPLYSAWLVESARFVDVPWGGFQPDKAGLNQLIDFPANYGIIKGPDGNLTLYDSGWKQLPYIYDWNNGCCGSPALQQMPAIGLDPAKVTKIVVGHGHWDHAGQLDSFPQATLYIQKEELKQIDFFINYPTDFNQGHIRAVNTVDPLTGFQVGPPGQACARTPVCGYPPQTLAEIQGKVLGGKAVIVDGRMEIAQGLIIHPAFRGHTYGSQLLQVHTRLGELVFGSDTFSSWTGIRDWLVANIQQTDTIQQFLAYEKCYVLTSRGGSFNNCLAAHEKSSYSNDYPITKNWWTIPGGNCSRAAELTLAPGEKSLFVKGNVVVNGQTIDAQIDSTKCRTTVFKKPTGYPIEP